MISQEVKKKYTPTIGIECHVQLKTKTKLFAAVGNDAREAPPNTLVSHICFGLPGALPVLNKEAIHLAMRAAFALNTTPQKHSYFERKHYFYPDLPMGYQISQLAQPIIVGGSVAIEVGGMSKMVRINRAQLEADAGKSTHPDGKDYSLVDLNRAGTPLLEIVSEPDIHSSEEAKAYARELYMLMRYADVSDCNLYYGNMRFDVNVSVSKVPGKLGVRTETKNINSFRAVEKAVDYEINRQIQLLEKGEKVAQETRGWDDAKQRTITQRTKENAEDYRYMPEPDIPPVELTDNMIDTVKQEMPVLPPAWRKRLAGLKLDQPAMELLLEAELDNPSIPYLSLIELAENQSFAKSLANWLVNLEIPLNRSGDVTSPLDAEARLHLYRAVHDLLGAGQLNSSNAKLLLTKLLAAGQPVGDIAAYAKQHNLIQQSDEAELEKIVQKVIQDNPKAAQDIAAGEAKAIGFLVGQIMKHSQGRANPSLAQQLIKRQLGL